MPAFLARAEERLDRERGVLRHSAREKANKTRLLAAQWAQSSRNEERCFAALYALCGTEKNLVGGNDAPVF